jgi:hypothetical protein
MNNAQILAELCKNLPAQPEGTMLEQAQQIADFRWDVFTSAMRAADADDIEYLNQVKKDFYDAKRFLDSLTA